jgi:hypothetical protein
MPAVRLTLHHLGRRFRLTDAGGFKEEDHPRVASGSEGGQFTSGGGGSGFGHDPHAAREERVKGRLPAKERVFYHGTSSQWFESIKKEGLKFAGVKRASSKPHFYKGELGESIYVADDLKKATNYAEMAARRSGGKKVGATPIILEVKVPAEVASKLKPDEMEDPGAWRHEGAIPPEWIVGYRKLTIKENKRLNEKTTPNAPKYVYGAPIVTVSELITDAEAEDAGFTRHLVITFPQDEDEDEDEDEGEDEDEDTADAFKEEDHPRVKKGGGSEGGQFTEGGGGGASGGKTSAGKTGGGKTSGGTGKASTSTAEHFKHIHPEIEPTKERAWTGRQNEKASRLGKLEGGAVGEEIAMAYIRTLGADRQDARPLNTKMTNFPVDLIGDHELYEVKTGQVGNSTAAQQWRATIGEPGPTEKELIAGMSAEQKLAHNQKKRDAIMQRKQQVVEDYAKETGRQVKGKTITVIIDPDRGVADVHVFDGFHQRIGYNSDAAKEGYVGSFKFRRPGKKGVGGDRAAAGPVREGAAGGPGPVLCGAGGRDGVSEAFLWSDFIPATKQSIDKDGFLLCRDVPVARTGVQLYGPGETPIDCADGQMVRIERTEDEVFHPDTIASLTGVPVVNNHPVDGYGTRFDVTPDNWRHLAVGHVENPRRGEGMLADFLVADLRIHDGDAIRLIQSGKRQVSAGYDASYLELGPLHGRQTNIRCNHMAIVDAARCGPICAIGDSNSCEEGDEMSTWNDRLRGLAKQYGFKARDTAELEAAIADAEEQVGGPTGGGTHVHVHTTRDDDDDKKDDKKDDDKKDDKKDDDTFDQGVAGELEELWQANEQEREAIRELLGGTGSDRAYFRDSFPLRDARRTRMGIRSRDADEDDDDDDDEDRKKRADDDFGGPDLAGGARKILREFEMEAPAGAQVVDVRKARDSRYLEESWSTTISKGEIIVPGSRPRGTFDRAAPPQRTYDAICGYRRAVLDMAYVQPESRAIIEGFTRGRFASAGKLTCGRVREVFDHVAEVKRASNNAGSGGRYVGQMAPEAGFAAGGASNLTDYQKQINEFYANRATDKR